MQNRWLTVFQLFKFSSHCLSPSWFLIRNQLLILLRLSDTLWAISLLLISRSSLCLLTVWVGVDLLDFTLEFVEIFGCTDWCFQQFGESYGYEFLTYSFCSFVSSASRTSGSVSMLDDVPQFLETLFICLHTFFFLFLRMCNFNSPVDKFANSFFCNSKYVVEPF